MRKYTSHTFATYERAAAAIRAAEGLSRLSPARAAEVRAAVERHSTRAEARAITPPERPIARLRRAADSRRESVVAPLIRRHYRTMRRTRWCEGSTIRVVANADPGTRHESRRWWDKGDKYPTTSSYIRANVAPDWLRSVQPWRLAVVDGLVTTHAVLDSTQGDISVYRASWLRQGRGVSLISESGAIARHAATGMTYHGRTPSVALAGLRRKMREQGLSPDDRRERDAAAAERARERAARRATQLTSVVSRLMRQDLGAIHGVEVRRADSLRAGNCAPGTDQFINRFFRGRTSATIGQIAAAVGPELAGESLTDARITLARQIAAACLHAIRRSRNARRLLA